MNITLRTNTPRLDEQVLAYLAADGSEMVHASFARQLEIELDAMTARAEKAEAQCASERVKVKVLRHALEKYRNTIVAGGTKPAQAALDATKDASK